MRNVFDQYAQPENRLTHALVTALAEDRRLLKGFLRWVGVNPLPDTRRLEVFEQRLPGDLETSEDEVERRGLPDAWIHDNNRWSLLIESKISSPLKMDQLRRHRSTAVRRGYEEITVLAIVAETPKLSLPEWVILRLWSEVYQWLVSAVGKSEWAGRVSKYMEILEAKMSVDGYLREGTLTTFSGVPFGDDYPYNYPEGRRVLILAMEELRKRKDLVKQLGINPAADGRGAITGKQSDGVWDFLRLSESADHERHTLYPHFTLGIAQNRIVCHVTIPHGIMSGFRRNVVDLGYAKFSDLLADVSNNILKGLSKAKGSVPWMYAQQVRFPSRRAEPFLDALLEFDLRTAFPVGGQPPVKKQSEWLQATFDVLKSKRSNFEVGVGAAFPYRTCKLTQQSEILDSIAATWIACKPLVDVLLKGN